MAQDSELKDAVSLIKTGRKEEAVSVLKNLLRKDRNNEQAWELIYTCVEKSEDKIFCLREILRINPSNEQAKIELNLLLDKNHTPQANSDLRENETQPSMVVDTQHDINKSRLLKRSSQITWNIFAFISFILSGVFIYFGYDKIANYYNSDSEFLNTNAYVGGDAYNYIINSNYAVGYYVLALIFVVIGIGFILAGYLDKLSTLYENSE